MKLGLVTCIPCYLECDFVIFRNIFEMMDVMKMDMANYTIQQIRPYLQQQSIEYERTKFQQFLDQQKGECAALYCWPNCR